MHYCSLSSRLRRVQQGATLLFALMALVILGFAAVALTRSVDTGVLIMGNLSFKQDTLFAGNSGAEQAIAWLGANVSGNALDNDQAASGYYSSRSDKLDATGNKTSAANPLPLVNWDGNCMGAVAGTYSDCTTLPFTSPTKVNGNKVQWVIVRLCNQPNTPAGGVNLCARPATISASTTNERGELSGGGRISSATASPYFRVIVRIEGPRNTVSFTESMIHF